MTSNMISSATIARKILRSNVRGRTRLTLFLARWVKSFQALPMSVAGGTLYADLRIASTHHLLTETLQTADEENVMRRVVTPDSTVLDVGAHIGVYTVLLANLVGSGGQVHAFEPNSNVLPALQLTIDAFRNVRLHPFALSDESRQATLIVPGDASMASLADWTNGEHGRTHRIPCELRRLDAVMESGQVPQPDFIKCDVEGAELLVFRGGMNTLNRVDAPVILFEANANTSRGFGAAQSSAMDFLRGLRQACYHFFKIGPGGELKAIESLDSNHVNVLAVPHSRLCRINRAH